MQSPMPGYPANCKRGRHLLIRRKRCRLPDQLGGGIMRDWLTIAAMGAVLILSGCRTPSAISHYDACAQGTTSFVAMVECGKQNRNANCSTAQTPGERALNIALPPHLVPGLAKPPCTAEGNALVQMADALAMSVRNNEMSEAEALRRFAEYKTGVIVAHNRDGAIAAAGRGPSTCVRNGNTVSCF